MSEFKFQEVFMTLTFVGRVWAASTKDDRLQGAIMQVYGCERDAASAHKRLFQSPSIAQAKKIVSSTRAWLRGETAPWAKGVVIFHNEKYPKIIEFMTQRKKEFDGLVDTIIKEVDPTMAMVGGYMAEARKRLGPLWDQDDYPSGVALRQKFEFAYVAGSPPDPEDFRVKMANRNAKAIQAEIARENEKKIAAINTKIAKDLLRELEHIADSIDRGAAYQYTRFKKLAEMVQTIPHINVGNSPEIADLADKVSQKMLVGKPEAFLDKEVAQEFTSTVKENPEISKRVRDNAMEIVEDLNGLEF